VVAAGLALPVWASGKGDLIERCPSAPPCPSGCPRKDAAVGQSVVVKDSWMPAAEGRRRTVGMPERPLGLKESVRNLNRAFERHRSEQGWLQRDGDDVVLAF
jgi:hypothetical protein